MRHDVQRRRTEAVPHGGDMACSEFQAAPAEARFFADALWRLGQPAEEVVPVLGELLKPDGRPYWAAATLREMGSEAKSALPIVCDTLDSAAHPSVRRTLVELLSTFGPETQVVERIIHALNDNDPLIVAAAARGLGKMNTRASTVLPALIEKLDDPDESTRLAAIEAIGMLGREEKGAADQLDKLLEDPSELVRRLSEEALRKTDSLRQLRQRASGGESHP